MALKMDRICRICLASEMSQVFTEIYKMNNQKIALKIFLISHVKIIEFKESPALVCAQCVKELYQCIQFRKKIQTSDEYFRSTENNLWKLKDEEAGGEFDLLQNSKTIDNEIEALDEDYDYEELDEVEELPLEIDTFIKIEDEEISADSLVNVPKPLTKRRGRKVKNKKRTYNRLPCKICGITLSRRQRLIQHERLHFIDATKSFYECDQCGKQFNQRFSIIPHFQKYHSFKLGAMERWKCAICENKTLPAGKMELHYKKIHSEFWSNPQGDNLKINKIEIPQVVKRRAVVKNRHKKSNKNWFLCGLCGNSFTSRYRYHKHLNDLHGIAEHEVVQKSPVTTVSAVVDHQEIKVSKNVPCQMCGKVFASVTTCKAHEKTHLDVKYVCDLCGSSFKVKAYLTAHVQKIHMRLKRFRCSICSQEFIHRELLNYHVRKHLNIRNYQCQFCQKSFVRKACMLIHERIHVNLRPYSCRYCERSFIHHSDHRRHELRHTTNAIIQKEEG